MHAVQASLRTYHLTRFAGWEGRRTHSGEAVAVSCLVAACSFRPAHTAKGHRPSCPEEPNYICEFIRLRHCGRKPTNNRRTAKGPTWKSAQVVSVLKKGGGDVRQFFDCAGMSALAQRAHAVPILAHPDLAVVLESGDAKRTDVLDFSEGHLERSVVV